MCICNGIQRFRVLSNIVGPIMYNEHHFYLRCFGDPAAVCPADILSDLNVVCCGLHRGTMTLQSAIESIDRIAFVLDRRIAALEAA
jgi:hypothetical protein